MTQVAVFWTIAAATLAWAFGDACRLLRRQLAVARIVWTAGAVAFVIHSVSAFVLLYDGSHSRALAETARQTAAMTGVDSAPQLRDQDPETLAPARSRLVPNLQA